MRQEGSVPAVVLINPKRGANVGNVVRMCSAYGVPQLWWTGERVRLDKYKGGRLPREERMKGYYDVKLFPQADPTRVLDQFPPGTVPVAIEVRENSELLPHFVHPENAVYVFGPEDGSIPQAILRACHRFVAIPVAHCLNLATAVGQVLYDRRCKRMAAEIAAGRDPGWRLSDFLKERRGYYDPDEEDALVGATAHEDAMLAGER